MRYLLPCLLLLGCASKPAIPPPASQPATAPASQPKVGQHRDRGVSQDRVRQLMAQVKKHRHRKVCNRAQPGKVACHARVRVMENGITPFSAGNPQGLVPADLQAAYAIPAATGSPLVAIVDAQDDPTAEADLAVYRKQFGLPPCTTANGCFKKVNQNGAASPLPAKDAGWSGEIALDLDMVSAACPNCKILLVEANSASMPDLGAAVNTAVKLGAVVVSNSYGGGEDSTIASSEAFFNHPGVAIFVSAGDNGYGAEYPASSKYVTAVGGTSLVTAPGTNRGWAEAAWGSADDSNGGTGSGCSGFVAKPTWQKDRKCALRTVGDVAAVADPSTGVAVYTTTGGSGWNVYGGTSAASPLLAAIYAATGQAKATPQLSYANQGAFYDVVTGTNGDCGGTYLCCAASGYDGPTGNGTPNGKALLALTGPPAPTPPPPVKADAGVPPAPPCKPVCTNKTCGPDGCTGTCGTCGAGATCTAAGTCTASGCAHALCVAGPPLALTCDPCVTQICASDAYCCNSAWDSICLGAVGSVCKHPCTPIGGCTHPVCSAGPALNPACDACAKAVCAHDSFCCLTAWDSACTAEVRRFCVTKC